MEDRYNLFKGPQLVRTREILLLFQSPRYTTVQRDLLSDPQEGQVIFNITTNTLNVYNGTVWLDLTSQEDLQDVLNYVDAEIDALNTAQTAKHDVPFYKGDIGAQTGVGYKTFSTQLSDRFHLSVAGTDIVAEEAGYYFVSVHQLVQTSGTSAVYLHIRKNGSTTRYAYGGALNTLYDLHVATIMQLAVNDQIQVYQQNTVTNAWSGQHSDISIYKISI